MFSETFLGILPLSHTSCDIFNVGSCVALFILYVVCLGLCHLQCEFELLRTRLAIHHFPITNFAHSECSINIGWIKLCFKLKMIKHKMYLCSPQCDFYILLHLGKYLTNHLFGFFNVFWSYTPFKCLGGAQDKYIFM